MCENWRRRASRLWRGVGNGSLGRDLPVGEWKTLTGYLYLGQWKKRAAPAPLISIKKASSTRHSPPFLLPHCAGAPGPEPARFNRLPCRRGGCGAARRCTFTGSVCAQSRNGCRLRSHCPGQQRRENLVWLGRWKHK